MKKLLTTIMIIILTICIMSGFEKVNASSFTFNAVSDKTIVKTGEEITITLSVSNIDLGDNGMQVLEGLLKYDKDVFETVTSSNMEGLNNWGVTYNDENTNLNGKFLVMTLSSGLKDAQSIAKIKLKVKENAPSKIANIFIENVTANDGTNLVKASDKTIPIKIEASEGNQGGSGSQSGNTQGGNQGGSGSQGENSQGGNQEGSGNQSGNTQGGNQGGSGSQSGNTQGGNQGESGSQGGNSQGGNQGGSGNQSGNTQGGNQGGSGSQGGNTQGGTQGGSGSQSGNAQGGSQGASGSQGSNNSSGSGTTNNKKVLPQTGTLEIYMGIAIIVLLGIGTISYIKYKKMM